MPERRLTLHEYKIHQKTVAATPKIYFYDDNAVSEGSTYVCWEGKELVGDNVTEPRMIKRFKHAVNDTISDILPRLVAERIEYSSKFGTILNNAAVNFGVFLNEPSVERATEMYMIQQRFEGTTLKELKPKFLKKELMYASSVAGTLQQLENKGYVYGDIKAENLLVKTGSTDIMFFDLNSSRSLSQIQSDKRISTNSLCPLNLDLNSNSNLKTIDTYMLGQLLAHRLLKDADHLLLTEIAEVEMDIQTFRSHLRTFEDDHFLTNAVARKLLALLKKALAVCSRDRYQSAADMKKALNEIVKELGAFEVFSCVNTHAIPVQSKYISRPELEHSVRKMIISHSFSSICGISGTGKTELARFVAKQMSDAGELDAVLDISLPEKPADNVSYSVNDLLQNVRTTWDSDGNGYALVRSFLQKADGRTLLLIHNYNRADEQFVHQVKMLAPHCKVLFTSQNSKSVMENPATINTPSVELDVDSNLCVSIFYRYCNQTRWLYKEEDVATLSAYLFDLPVFMTVIAAGIQVKTSPYQFFTTILNEVKKGISPKDLLQPRFKISVSLLKDDSLLKGKPMEIISDIFARCLPIANLSEMERQYLQLLCLVPGQPQEAAGLEQLLGDGVFQGEYFSRAEEARVALVNKNLIITELAGDGSQLNVKIHKAVAMVLQSSNGKNRLNQISSGLLENVVRNAVTNSEAWPCFIAIYFSAENLDIDYAYKSLFDLERMSLNPQNCDVFQKRYPHSEACFSVIFHGINGRSLAITDMTGTNIFVLIDASNQLQAENRYFAEGKESGTQQADFTSVEIIQFLDRYTSIYIPAFIASTPVTKIGFAACAGNCHLTQVSFPNTIQGIDSCAFIGCHNLATVDFPSQLKEIGFAAFRNCKNLKSIILPNGLASIAASTFENCTRLSDAILPDSLTGIGHSAFKYCSHLATICFPKQLKIIGDHAFLGCWNLTKISFQNNLVAIGAASFADCANISEIALPESLRFIGSGAFCGCSQLDTVILPEHLKSISSDMFFGCTSLKKVTMPKFIEEIKNQAFLGCINLSELFFSDTLRIIRNRAFRDCTALRNLFVAGPETNIERYAFFGCDQLTIHAPLGSIAEGYARRYGIPFQTIS